MSVTSTPRLPLPSGWDGGSLEAVVEELRRRGWAARVVRRTVVGELDVRLRVTGSGTAAAELLDAWGSAPCGDRWHAVKIAPHSRAVWCGPARPCRMDELTSFVEDLLRLDRTELVHHYRELG